MKPGKATALDKVLHKMPGKVADNHPRSPHAYELKLDYPPL